jgi:hypothetical protein
VVSVATHFATWRSDLMEFDSAEERDAWVASDDGSGGKEAVVIVSANARPLPTASELLGWKARAEQSAKGER